MSNYHKIHFLLEVVKYKSCQHNRFYSNYKINGMTSSISVHVVPSPLYPAGQSRHWCDPSPITFTQTDDDLGPTKQGVDRHGHWVELEQALPSKENDYYNNVSILSDSWLLTNYIDILVIKIMWNKKSTV